MIVLWGLSTEGPIRRVRHELDRLGEDFVIIDQWRAAEIDVHVRVDGEVAAWIRLGDRELDLEEVTALYARPYDWTQLCAARGLPPDEPEWTHIRLVEEALYAWWDVAGGTIVNPPAAMASNGSKPYQSMLIREAGLAIPETLVTTDPSAARRFWDRHGAVIYKSVSGVRSCVSQLTAEDDARLPDVVACPTQFQQYVPGTDVRVHVIGDELFATEIVTDATDYRYASRQGAGDPEIRACTLPNEIQERCTAVTTSLGLLMSGIDLRRTPDGQWYCLEVNPSPGFTYYESATGQPLAAATARLLRGSELARASRLAETLDRPEGPTSGTPGLRTFIRSNERPDVGLAAVEELLMQSDHV